MNILAISPFPPVMSGGSKATFNILQRISKRNKIYLITYSKSRAKNKNFLISPLFLPLKSSLLRGIVFILYGIIIGLKQSFTSSVDVIYAKNLTSPGIIGLVLSFITRKSLIVHTSGPDISRLDLRAQERGVLAKPFFVLMKKIRKIQLKRSSAVIANCEADKLACYYYYKNVHVIRIYNGVDYTTFSPGSIDEKLILKNKMNLPNVPIIGYTGRASIQKNTKILLEIANKMKNYVFLVVGPTHKELEKFGQISSNMKITGSVSDVHNYLKQMDIFILPSQSEGMSNSLLEAMATGLCCLCFPVGEVPYLIEHEKNGIICQNKYDLIDTIECIIKNPQLREAIGKKARATILKEFDWDVSAKKIEKIFFSVYNKNHR